MQKGYRTVASYLCGTSALVGFLSRVFGAEILQPGTPDESGRFHAEVAIGDSKLMVGSGYFAFPPMAAAFWVYVADVEAT